MRRLELERSEADRIKSIQDNLRTETSLRSSAFGLRALLGPLLGGNRVRSLLGSG